VPITRGRRAIAEIAPSHRRTGADLRAALAETQPPDDHFADGIADALALLTEGGDPWADS